LGTLLGSFENVGPDFKVKTVIRCQFVANELKSDNVFDVIEELWD